MSDEDRRRKRREAQEVIRRKRIEVSEAAARARILLEKDGAEAEAEAARAAAKAALAEEAVEAVTEAAKGVGAAALDAALSAAASSATGESSAPWQRAFGSWATARRDSARASGEAAARVKSLTLFEDELSILGISIDEAPRLDEKRLRRALRNRAKQVHPDTKVDEAAPTSGSGGHSRPDGELTIYDLNEAYEAVKKVLF